MTPSRRRLLASIAAVGGLSGCLAGVFGGSGDDRVGGTRTPADTEPAEDATGDGGEVGTATGGDGSPTPTEIPLAQHGTPATICQESVNERSGIDAVVDPAFDDEWTGYEVGREYSLDDDEVVIGLERQGQPRAYPISILNLHEVVNDRLGGPVVVTYCPLCNSGMVASRRVRERTLEFLVSGLLWQAPGLQTAVRQENGEVFGVDGRNPNERLINRGNLVMYDSSTRSFWSQVLATSICGEFQGERLRILPSTTATWRDWRGDHPDTEVLLPPPHSRTDSSA